MENLQYSKIFKKNWELVALIMGVTVVLALIISLLQPFQYSATTKILIIQKQDKNLDAYTATKSAERIGKNLASIINTSSFYNEVIDSNQVIAEGFPQDSRERRKAWEKNVKSNVIPETGILEIDVYDTDRTYASQLVKSIAYVLVNKGSDYHGGGTDVEIKIVDDVFLSKYPVRPNIILNTALALVVGFLLGSASIILSEARKSKVSQKTAEQQQTIFDSIKTKELESESEEDDDNFELIDDDTENEAMDLEPQFALSNEDESGNGRFDKTEIKTMHDHLQ